MSLIESYFNITKEYSEKYGEKTAVLDTCRMPGCLRNRLTFQRPWVAFTRVYIPAGTPLDAC